MSYEFEREDRIELDGVDLTPYLVNFKQETTTVRYTPYRYTGWRRWWRRLTFRPVESDTFEFEAEFSPDPEFLPGDESDDVTGFSYSAKVVGPVRKVSNQDSAPAKRFQCEVGPGCENARPDEPCCGIPARVSNQDSAPASERES